MVVKILDMTEVAQGSCLKTEEQSVHSRTLWDIQKACEVLTKESEEEDTGEGQESGRGFQEEEEQQHWMLLRLQIIIIVDSDFSSAFYEWALLCFFYMCYLI